MIIHADKLQQSRKLLQLHTCSDWTSHWSEFLAPMSVNYAWPLPEVNWTTTVRDLYHLWGACPCLPWSAVAMHVLTWVVFTLGFFHADVALQQQPFTDSGLGTRISKDDQWLWNILNALYGIWPQVSKQANIHTHIYMHAVWGLLRLTQTPPISLWFLLGAG